MIFLGPFCPSTELYFVHAFIPFYASSCSLIDKIMIQQRLKFSLLHIMRNLCLKKYFLTIKSAALHLPVRLSSMRCGKEDWEQGCKEA